jgi:hypothetical protein
MSYSFVLNEGFFTKDIEVNCIDGKNVIWNNIEEAIKDYYKFIDNKDADEDTLKMAKESFKVNAGLEGYKLIW